MCEDKRMGWKPPQMILFAFTWSNHTTRTAPTLVGVCRLTVLVSLGCHNRLPQTRWLKPRHLISIQFWRLESPRSSSGSLVPGENSFWFIDVSLCTASSPGEKEGRGGGAFPVPHLVRPQSYRMWAPPHDLTEP